MKMWVKRVALWVLRMLGEDPERKMRDVITEIIRMRNEVEGLKAAKGYAEQMLQERVVRVDLGGMIPVEQRHAMLKALWEVPEVKGLKLELDAAWLGEINSMTHPQMSDRDRQWAAGRAEAYMTVKSWVEKR